MAAATVGAASSSGATSGTVVGATVPSATAVDGSACAPASAATNLGTVLAGSTVFSSAACTVTFGSSNDSATLRIAQSDGRGVAFARPTDGTLFSSFGTGGVGTVAGTAVDDIEAMLVQPDGKVLLGGDSGNSATVTRLKADGSLDTTFGTSGTVTRTVGFDDHVLALSLQADGKILVGGRTWGGSDNDGFVLRYDTTGVADGTFGTGGLVNITHGGVRHENVAALAQRPDGTIQLFGFDNQSVSTTRLLASGARDTSWRPAGEAAYPTGADIEVTSAATMADGRMVLAGAGNTYSDFLVARLNADGTLDTTFNGTGMRTIDDGGSEMIRSIAVDATGRITWAGYAGNDVSLGRLLASGANDPSFRGGGRFTLDPSAGGVDRADRLDVLADGRLLATGSATVGGTERPWLGRFLATGANDPSFGTGGSLILSAQAAGFHAGGVVAEDGSVIAGGRTTGTVRPTATKLVGVPVPDFVSGVNDWTTSNGTFGVCLETAANTVAADWTAAGGGGCTPGATTMWHAVPAAVSTVRAAATATSQTGTVGFRFGFRAAANQAPGAYLAPITFDVIAPAA
ncbi:MAG: hypothetical protein JWM98_1447 [Thermoleophilia bacterium]|nr:hypothetical protein [Thermoleophilia bacterium]